MIQIGIVGATGAVGLEARKVASEILGDIPYSFSLFASKARPDENILSLESADAALSQCEFIINAANAEQAQYVRARLKPGQVLVDNSSAYRMEQGTPLVVPEVNGDELLSVARQKDKPWVVANPNCTAAILCVALAPLKKFGLERVTVSTYQAASGAGLAGLQELEGQLQKAFDDPSTWNTEVFRSPLLLNVLSHNSKTRSESSDQGALYNDEEWKVIEETRKMLQLPDLWVSASCMRVPVRRAHTESVTVDVKRDLNLQELRDAFAQAPGVLVEDNLETQQFPSPLKAQNQDKVLVGRIRLDATRKSTLHFMAAGDQLRKGAASNALQIIRRLVELKG